MEDIIVQWIGGFVRPSYLQNDYVFAGLIVVLFFVLANIILWLFGKYLEKFAKKTKTIVDDLIFEHTRKPIFYFIQVYGIKIALLLLGFNGAVITKIVNSLLALVFVFIFSRSVDIIIETWGNDFAKKTKTNIDEVLLPLFHKASKVVFVIIAIMWVLDIWNINITPYLAGVGMSGIVLGLALQDSLKNVFGGITLLLDKTFKQGDKVGLESGEVGTIHDIGLRSTKLVTYDNEVIYIPNGYLANSRVRNYTRPSPKVRVVIPFSIEYGSDVPAVKELILGVVKKIEGVLEDPAAKVDFVGMGDSSLNFQAKFWVKRWDEAYGLKLTTLEAIHSALVKGKIGIPFPTRTIYMKNSK